MSDFDAALAEVLKDEGGYVNHPKDPGGATNKGVTQRVYDAYRARVGLPQLAVRLIGQNEVEAIYRASYWDLAKCGQLPAGVSYVVFDGAVNSGVKQSVKWLQRALGVRDDGIIGPTTIAAAGAANPFSLIDKICDARLAFLKSLKTWSTFGRGWLKRVERVRMLGKAMIGVAPVPAHMANIDVVPTPKANVEDAKTPPAKAVGDVLAGVGGASVVISQTIDNAVSQLTPYANIGVVSNILVGLTVAGAVVGIAGILYRTWATIKGREIKDATQAGTP